MNTEYVNSKEFNLDLFRYEALDKLMELDKDRQKSGVKYMQAGMDVSTYIELKKPLPLSERFYPVRIV